MDITGLDKWHFELTESACNELLGLVLDGRKRATSSSVYSFKAEGQEIPNEGDMSVITDWNGEPKCVIRTSKVHVLPFRSITFDLARLEGEDDSLESWRRNHEKFFSAEGLELGYEFSEDMDVVFEEFEVVEIL
ncbi:MAG: ASCH domain-containing protein [Mogibacterium sp.]|nr:ASCH domain-containing protein [Oscillospiraceae bacterium]MBR3125442.1 ASCH domain-containing protein [Mogibacterium sp.]